MKKAIWKFFQFTRIVDEKKQLSLTNLGVIIVLIRFATTKDAISPVDVGALIGTLVPYQAKKWAPKDSGPQE